MKPNVVVHLDSRKDLQFDIVMVTNVLSKEKAPKYYLRKN